MTEVVLLGIGSGLRNAKRQKAGPKGVNLQAARESARAKVAFCAGVTLKNKN